MKKIIMFFVVSIMILNGTLAHAQSQSLSRDELFYQINILLAQIASLQAILAERERGVSITRTPSITITEPSPFMAVKDGNSYTVSWEAKSIPANSKLIMDTRAILLYGGSGVGGGSYSETMVPGNTNGSRILKTGVGYSDPGTYEVRVMAVACADIFCSRPVVGYDSATGQSISLTKVHAKSDWVRYSISADEKLSFVGNGTITIGDVVPNEGKFRLGESMKISYYLFGDVKKEHEACILFRSDAGKLFSLNSDFYSACAPAKVGLNERYWTPYRTTGFQLNPGLYKVNIVVPNIPNNSGKDSAYAAEKSGNWIELLPEA